MKEKSLTKGIFQIPNSSAANINLARCTMGVGCLNGDAFPVGGRNRADDSGAPAARHVGQGTQGLGERRPLSSLMVQALLGQLPRGQYKQGAKQNKSREEPKAGSGQRDSERPQERS